jgi:hypothetical protein
MLKLKTHSGFHDLFLNFIIIKKNFRREEKDKDGEKWL